MTENDDTGISGRTAFLGLGAYFFGLLAVKLHLGFWPAFFTATAITGLCGFSIGIPALRLSRPYSIFISYSRLRCVDGIHTFYGTFEALRGVSLDVNDGEVVTIPGANGTGKSTLLRTISALIRPPLGSIYYNGKRIDEMTPDAIVKLGISHCPEGRMLFPEMPVYKNLELGAYVRRKTAVW